MKNLIKNIEKEANDLDDKLLKLDNFLETEEFDNLNFKHQELLKEQRYYMKRYYHLLKLRIFELWKEENKKEEQNDTKK